MEGNPPSRSVLRHSFLMHSSPTCRDHLRKAGLRDRAEQAGRHWGSVKGQLCVSPAKLFSLRPGFVALRAGDSLKDVRARGTGIYSTVERKMPSAGYALIFQKVLVQRAGRSLQDGRHDLTLM